VDDFGITPVEALAYGTPVIAIKKGGVKEIMIEGKTGEFFDAATPESITSSVKKFMERESNYDREFLINRAKEFSKERFIREFTEYLGSLSI